MGDSVTQIIEVRTYESGAKYWYSDQVGWVQHDTIEMRCEDFPEGTKVTIECGDPK